MDKSLVSKATTTDEAVTPGYLYREISKITTVSAEASRQLEEFLLKRLKVTLRLEPSTAFVTTLACTTPATSAAPLCSPPPHPLLTLAHPPLRRRTTACTRRSNASR